MASPQKNPAQAPPHAHNLRVILVGRTGLDGRLRLDSRIELTRVRTPLEAVGELSDNFDGAAARVVIVSVDADPAVASLDGQPPGTRFVRTIP